MRYWHESTSGLAIESPPDIWRPGAQTPPGARKTARGIERQASPSDAHSAREGDAERYSRARRATLADDPGDDAIDGISEAETRAATAPE